MGSQNDANRTGKYAHLPQGYKVVFVAPASPSGNVSSVCANRACSYNFANGTYTHIPSGRIYGESINWKTYTLEIFP